MHATDWGDIIRWAVMFGAPLLGGMIWLLACGGPHGEKRNKMWTQGPFVPSADDQSTSDRNE